MPAPSFLQLQPRVSDLVAALAGMRDLLPATYSGREQLVRWLGTLNSMRAHDELTDDQIRQFRFDVENAYNDFEKAL